jgi:rhodanese-related sulfurtransferase
MKRIVLVALAMLLYSVIPAMAENYVQPDTFKQWLESGKPVIIVDIQVPDEFEKHHFKKSIETNAYPAKTDEEKRKLDGVLSTINSSKKDVVIICPRGAGGAKNTYEYLKTKGVVESRMHILDKGIDGWPYKEMFVQGR